jgi:hypothetical protein
MKTVIQDSIVEVELYIYILHIRNTYLYHLDSLYIYK